MSIGMLSLVMFSSLSYLDNVSHYIIDSRVEFIDLLVEHSVNIFLLLLEFSLLLLKDSIEMFQKLLLGSLVLKFSLFDNNQSSLLFSQLSDVVLPENSI